MTDERLDRLDAPTTEAGRALTLLNDSEFEWAAAEPIQVRRMIRAIEDEARAALVAQNKALREALRTYGDHSSECGNPCDCGLFDALREAGA